MILNSPYISGSLTVTGNITSQGGITISGSITSASYATTSSFATTASYANTSTSASYALTASFATNFTASNLLVTGLATIASASITYLTTIYEIFLEILDKNNVNLKNDSFKKNIKTKLIQNYIVNYIYEILLKYDKDISSRPFVDWVEVEKILIDRKIL